ncbi:MAG TPA: 5'-3' exonuclease H3TH domain-containing protein, partial [Candidatus Limnocylindria bacterium]|nr:5'-3' exonuclease H3TH domain-containing protein [Candidatus Limnocylindria bacterium]
RGVLDSVLSLLREPGVTHLAAATDHVIRSWRNDRYPGYKTEVGMPADLLAQFADAERGLAALGVVTWPMVEWEADDALATAVARYADDPRVEQTVICSVDMDLAQCVRGSRVVLRDRMRNVTYDEAGVIAKFGVPPASIPDWLALVGDSADGYPGLPGWGARSAAAVLARWGSLDRVPEGVGGWDLPVPLRNAPRLAATLRDLRDEALLYRELARLRTDVPIRETIEELEWQGAPSDEFHAFCAELGLDTPTRVHRWRDG